MRLDAIVSAVAVALLVASLSACTVSAPPRSTAGTSTTTATTPSVTPGSATATAASGSATSGTATAGTATVVATTTATPVSPSVTPTASPAPVPPMEPSVLRLKYILFDRFGSLWYCDPDFYPIARQDEQTLAEQRFPGIEGDAGTFAAIIAHLGYAPAMQYTATQQLAVYRDWKMLRALQLDPVSGGYRFDARFTHDHQTGVQVQGGIAFDGTVTVTSQVAAGRPNCPICLARGTPIATPDGAVAVEMLRVGMMVWSVDAHGARIAAPVLAVGSTSVPASHQMVDLVLADGREVHASPAHPLADGRPISTLAAGDVVDGSTVVSADHESYAGGATFDLLPTSLTGVYWAEDIPLRSTMLDASSRSGPVEP